MKVLEGLRRYKKYGPVYKTNLLFTSVGMQTLASSITAFTTFMPSSATALIIVMPSSATALIVVMPSSATAFIHVWSFGVVTSCSLNFHLPPKKG
jgi:hypothetical protein